MLMSILDILFLFLIIIYSSLGANKGFIKIMLSIIDFVFSIFITYFLYPIVKSIFVKHQIINNSYLVISLSLVLAYFISKILVKLSIKKVFFVLSPLSGSIIDRFLGFVIGFLKGSIICMLIFLIVNLVYTGNKYLGYFSQSKNEKSTPDWLKKSFTAKLINCARTHIVFLLKKSSTKFSILDQILFKEDLIKEIIKKKLEDVLILKKNVFSL